MSISEVIREPTQAISPRCADRPYCPIHGHTWKSGVDGTFDIPRHVQLAAVLYHHYQDGAFFSEAQATSHVEDFLRKSTLERSVRRVPHELLGLCRGKEVDGRLVFALKHAEANYCFNARAAYLLIEPYIIGCR